jgi:hypothetical protein
MENRKLLVQLKKLFTGYRTLTSKLRKQLKRMGFIVTEKGKHYRIYREDNVHGPFVPFAKTGSDNREGINIALSIYRNLVLQRPFYRHEFAPV